MSRTIYVETSPSGDGQFVSYRLSRSRSHSHGQHHRHDHATIKVSLEEWDRLKERERSMADANQILLTETQSLKSNLATSQAEVTRLSKTVPQLETQIAVLYEDNLSLRRSLGNAEEFSTRHCRDLDKLQSKIDKAERENKETKEENSDLRAKVRSLTRQVDQGLGRRMADLISDLNSYKDQCSSWRGRYDNLRQSYDRLQDLFDTRTEKLKVFEEILQRRGLI